MDCHVFRRLCDELTTRLVGARIEKIASPAPGLTAFLLYLSASKSTLFLRASHRNPFMFLSETRIQNPPVPPAYVMRLRKHCLGHRIADVVADWPDRRMFLRVNADGMEFPWLELDLKDGPVLLGALPGESLSVRWPESCTDDADWRIYPVLTPLLRRTLVGMPAPERDALWEDLKAGGGDLFLYRDGEGTVTDIAAWPLPSGHGREETFPSPLEAIRLYGEKVVLPDVALAAGREALKKRNATLRKLDRLLEKTNEDRRRLLAMADAKRTALALQAELYRFPPDQKASKVRLLGSAEPVRLDPAKTIRENMEHLFRQADRGTRGLGILEGRVATLRAERDRILGDIESNASDGYASEQPRRSHQGKSSQAKWPKDVQRFRSADGFLLLRGRDAKGNLAVLKLASPHDIWMHVGGAAGAHVAIRLHHALQDVPERTLRQAALLAVEKSERRNDANADAIYARMKHIKPIRGSKAGAVNIAELMGSIGIVVAEVEGPRPMED